MSGEPHPPQFSPPQEKGGEEKHKLLKIARKTARWEYTRPDRYMSEFRRDVSKIPSSNRASQRRRWKSEPGMPFGQYRRGKRREGEEKGAVGSTARQAECTGVLV